MSPEAAQTEADQETCDATSSANSNHGGRTIAKRSSASPIGKQKAASSLENPAPPPPTGLHATPMSAAVRPPQCEPATTVVVDSSLPPEQLPARQTGGQAPNTTDEQIPE
ncbi:PREDICTED: uncharacterized protein LOC109170879 [Ipomoea nil]|uniref:uncharacterized protein LOC109170879 n=1 Tax=Ipomoea nil TaxID=35883 RepID=UPI0009010221|nr:PREDICTED: uncharacterized protein LOC109170879 [Ipomoea nil]